jgi:hypothetical protein
MIEVTKERRDEIFRKVAEKVVDMKLTPVAIVMLESSKPISFVGSQLMVFFQPIYSAVFPAQPYNEIATLLEDRANIEILIREIEKVEEEIRSRKDSQVKTDESKKN